MSMQQGLSIAAAVLMITGAVVVIVAVFAAPVINWWERWQRRHRGRHWDGVPVADIIARLDVRLHAWMPDGSLLLWPSRPASQREPLADMFTNTFHLEASALVIDVETYVPPPPVVLSDTLFDPETWADVMPPWVWTDELDAAHTLIAVGTRRDPRGHGQCTTCGALDPADTECVPLT